MAMPMVTKEQIQSVKPNGFLFNRDSHKFSARIITKNGVLTADQMNVVTRAAKEFGNGNIALTVRLTLELQGIPFERIPEFTAYMQTHGLAVGGTGPRVRPVVTCKGTTCSNGLCDTFAVANEIHTRFYEGYRGVTLPHKFKIAAGGCPNNCVKPDLNDIGIVALKTPKLLLESCKGCTTCSVAAVCPAHAASVQKSKLHIDLSLCHSCGSCAGKCHFGVVEAPQAMFKVYMGGKWGKRTRNGSLLGNSFGQTQALDLIEKAILLFKKEGQKGERFGDMIDRIGVAHTEMLLLSDTLFQEKAEILATPKQAGATC